MTTVHHLARAVGSTGSTTTAYRVDLRVGAHQLTADEPTAPVTLAIAAGTPITTTLLP